MFYTIFQIANITAQDILSVPGFSLSVHFDPIPLVMRENGNTHGTNMMGSFVANNIAGEASNMIWYTQYRWSNKADDGKIASAAATMLNWVETNAAVLSKAHPFRYLNVAGSGQHLFQSYGPQYVDVLQRSARLYDPSGVFQKVMPGGFKVFDDTPVFNPAPVFGGM